MQMHLKSPSFRSLARTLAGLFGVTVASGLVVAVLLGSLPAGADPVPSEALAPLAAYVGKTWRGEFSDSTPEQPKIDVARWEWALNGQAIRVVHSINDGEYGGETLLLEDPEGEGVIFYYFTTGGFYTHGHVRIEDGKLITYEKVKGAGQVTEVRATAERLADGRMLGSAEYKRDGIWTEGHTVTYREAPGAEVVFRNPE